MKVEIYLRVFERLVNHKWFWIYNSNAKADGSQISDNKIHIYMN